MKKTVMMGPWVDRTDTCGATRSTEHFMASVYGWKDSNNKEVWEAQVTSEPEGNVCWDIPKWATIGEQAAKRLATINLKRLEEDHNKKATA